jgi:hypothetical protein
MSIAQDYGRVNDCLDATDKIIALLALPEVKGYCTHGAFPEHLQSRTNPSHEKVMKLACKSWHCPICSARLRESKGLHFGEKLLEAEGDLFMETSEPSDWTRQRRELSRRGASWVRVAWPGQPGVILGSKPSGFGKPISDPAEAVRLLGKALRDLVPVWAGPNSRSRPINCSRDWTPPEKPSRYKRLGSVRVSSPEEVRSVLSGLGIDCRVRNETGSKIWVVIFHVPAGMELIVKNTLNHLIIIESTLVPISLLEERDTKRLTETRLANCTQ